MGIASCWAECGARKGLEVRESVNIRAESVENREIDLIDFLVFLRRRMVYVIGAAGGAAVCALVYVLLFATPIYEATAQLYVVNSRDSVINLSDLQMGSYLTSDYQLVFGTWEVNQQVIEKLGLSYTVGELSRMLTVENPGNTRALSITVASANAAEAARIANEYAEVAGEYIAKRMLTDKPTVLSTALEPLEPARPRKKLIVLGAAAVGGFLSVCALLAIYVLDDRVKTSADVQKYANALPLAIIPLSTTAGLQLRRRR